MYEFNSFSLIDAPEPCAIVFVKGCPLSCKYCYNIELRKVSSGLNLIEIITNISKLQDINPSGEKYNTVDWIIFSGGEPFPQMPGFKQIFSKDSNTISRDTLYLLNLAKDKGFKTGIYTIGLSKYFKEAIKENLLDFVNIDYKHFSLESVEIHKRERANYFVSAYLKIIMENIQEAYSSYSDSRLEYLYLNTVLCKSTHNKDTFKIMREWVDKTIPDIPIFLKRDFSKKLGWILTPFFNDNNKISTLGNLTSNEIIPDSEVESWLI